MTPFSCPWEDLCNWNEHADNLVHTGSLDGTTLYQSFIRHLHAQCSIYDDGSETLGALSGGAGMAVTKGDSANSTALLTKQQHGAAIVSSYDEEKAAMRMALE